ncbi:class A beta-lactamase-related serine hydrolase [Lentilactobacillus diolivorans]|uniref:class A beta-lactamase-related serine hydrolase n=1 Tax=Lentilactobacillus diolivorans TaxID=179838 RepID=UPI002469A767|nr:class A beta-lactamase-related serine hydrolase [Lentilactobacillus diolivorans]MDH5104233.1 class A beta-lactamase-related serine hydrolase [Lentilactobacillus diolivorans]
MQNLDQKMTELLSQTTTHTGILIQLNGETIFEKNANRIFPSASLIKLAILNAVIELRPNLKQNIRIDPNRLAGGAGILQLMTRSTWTLQDLLALMISVSDNAASNVIIDHFGMDTINEYLVNHQFEGTRLNRYLMDTNALRTGRDNLTSAVEAVRLLQIALEHSTMVSSWFANQQSRYKLPGNFDELTDQVTVFNKTGEGVQIDHDVARFVYNNNVVDVALLTSKFQRRMDALRLFNQIGQLIFDFVISKP